MSHCNARGTDEFGGFLHAVKGEEWQIPAALRSSIIAAAPDMLKLIARLRRCPVSDSGALIAGNSIWDELDRVYRLAHGLSAEHDIDTPPSIFNKRTVVEAQPDEICSMDNPS